MPDEPYTLSDLASLADVTPRTIRYYVAQGLLPSPDAAGPATRYGEGHLVRLRIIKRLQRDHLPLSEIRARLEHMGEDEIELLLNEAAQVTPPAPEETLAFVQNLMTQAGVGPRAASPRADDAGAASPRTADAGTAEATDSEATDSEAADAPPTTPRRSLLKRVESSATYEPMVPESYPLRSEPATKPAHAPAPMPSAPMSPSIPVASGSGKTPDRSTWERLAVTPDVELHIRRPLDRLTNKKVDHLVRIARELFDEEP